MDSQLFQQNNQIYKMLKEIEKQKLLKINQKPSNKMRYKPKSNTLTGKSIGMSV
ncbi:MAG: hypothetical protein SAqTSB_37980 [Shewanella algae]